MPINLSTTWTRVLATSVDDYSHALVTGLDGAIYLTGATGGALDGQTNSGGTDAFLTKYTPDGTKVWTRLLGTGGEDVGAALTIGLDGSIYMTGYTRGSLDGQTNSGAADAFLTKYTPDGAKVWTQLLGTGGNDFGAALTIGLDESIYVSGHTSGGFSPSLSLDGLPRRGGTDIFLVKYSDNPTLLDTYSLTSIDSSINEGSSASFTLSTSNVAAGTALSYVISGVQAADFVGGQLTGSVTVDAQGRATISIPIAAENFTEGPETMTVTVRSAQGADLATASVTINDTSLTPTMVFNQIQGTEGPDLLNSTSGTDQINAGGGNDTILGSAGSDTIDGGAGIDVVRYNTSSQTATIARLTPGEVTVRRGSDTDTLVNVERLQFTDQWVAIDLKGNAGVAGQMIVAAFGRQSLSEYMGIGLSLVDQGWIPSQLAELIVSAGLLPSSNTEFVKLVYQNVVGTAPNALELAFYVQVLNDGSYTQTSLLNLAANTDFATNAVEQSAIGLVGLPYQPSLV